MGCLGEYHLRMWRCVRRPAVLVASLVLPGLFLTVSYAQINGTPSSVTSPGFGGRPVNGAPASVTSLGPRGYAPNPQVRFSAPARARSGDGQHSHNRHHRQGQYDAPLLYAYPYPVPYETESGPAQDYSDAPDLESESTYEGGPTVFDRRGSGARSYVPPVNDSPRPASSIVSDNPESVPEPVDPTLLVFKDGHKLEVENYAIVGATLFDLTAGHPRKIALAELDLDATRKQNDDRGILFQLPPSARMN
jgi:hypothetical protein